MNAWVRVCLLILVQAKISCARSVGTDDTDCSSDLLLHILVAILKVLKLLAHRGKSFGNIIRIVRILSLQEIFLIAPKVTYYSLIVFRPQGSIILVSQIIFFIFRILTKPILYVLCTFVKIYRVVTIPKLKKTALTHCLYVLVDIVVKKIKPVNVPQRNRIVLTVFFRRIFND